MNESKPIQWATKALNDLGINILKEPEVVRAMPWSTVTRVSTSSGDVYLKQMSPQFAVEPLVLNLLLKDLSAPVTKVIAHDPKSYYFLMQEAGACLRNKLKDNYDTSLVCQVLKSYAQIQLNAIDKQTELLALGVKDWRLEKLPALYINLLAQENLLFADGLSPDDIVKLKTLYGTFVEDCNKLDTFAIAQTIEHGDFHDNNVLISDNNIITFNDWGDTNITHPFFSLGSWLDSASRNHHLHKKDPRYHILCTAYLEAWRAYAPMDKLFEAFELSERLRPILFCINFCRVTSCKGMEKLGQFKGYIAQALKEYISLMSH